MSRVSKFIPIAAVAFAAMSCASQEEVADMANVEGVLSAAPASEIVIGKLDINQLVILDTLTTDAEGGFSYQLQVKKGDPEFVYVYSEGKKVMSLLLDAGDDVSFTVDADGAASIKGSQESEKLLQVEKEHSDMTALFAELSAAYESASESQQKKIAAEMTKAYRDYNRSSVKYVVENTHSLTVIPVLYRTLGVLPVFNMTTDAVLFTSVADSLQVTYPDSKYVKSLKADAAAKYAQLEMRQRLDDADVVGYFDIELPGLDGQMKKLSQLDSKVTLLYFWTASNVQQNHFNVDVLKRLYNKYHKRGFDIYQVSLDVDKVMWATTVMGQELPWTNVCDMRGVSSPYVSMYNIQVIPSAFVICNGELVDGEIVDEASFSKLLDKLLK